MNNVEITQEQFDYIVEKAFEYAQDSFYTNWIMNDLSEALGLEYDGGKYGY